ncbi:LytR C-terminal domain-containing protein [candidate division WOR-3 bacterium]|nr:LytR C-terminal domain-containing protein [candidate division WOR-3 bacterium]
MKKIVSIIIIIIGLLSIVLLVSSGDKIRLELAAREPKKIRVTVLNGTTIDGLAARAREYLKKNECDVLQVRNASTSYEKTVIIDRVDRELGNARRIRHLLRIGEISYEPDQTHIVEVTVILGEDYKLEE